MASLSTSAQRPSDGTSFGIRKHILAAALSAVVLVAGFGGWGLHAELTGAVVTSGKVAVRQQVKLVQHRDGGIVADILVSNGDTVKAGDVLIHLDETQTKAELGIAQAQLYELMGRKARLIAERDGAEQITFEPGFADDPATAAIARGERAMFDSNRASRQARREQLVLQVAQYEEQVAGLRSQQVSNAAERELLVDDMDRLRPLIAKQYMDVNKFRAMERDLVKLDGTKGELVANIARINGQVSEAKVKIIELDQQVQTDAQKELRDIDGRMAELQERLIAIQDRMSRMDLRAPIAGIVNDLTVHTVNGVISPKETLMTIVPANAELIVEARIAPQDIDQVATGQPARLRFTAFSQRTTPEIEGTVETIGAAASVDPSNGQTYYLGQIAIGAATDRLGGKRLVPGMPVEVFMTTGERTALSYLAKPFVDQVTRAFRER